VFYYLFKIAQIRTAPHQWYAESKQGKYALQNILNQAKPNKLRTIGAIQSASWMRFLYRILLLFTKVHGVFFLGTSDASYYFIELRKALCLFSARQTKRPRLQNHLLLQLLKQLLLCELLNAFWRWYHTLRCYRPMCQLSGCSWNERVTLFANSSTRGENNDFDIASFFS
jgi:hypothetical protein